MEKMPKFEANLQWMFNEYELLDRYDVAVRAGHHCAQPAMDRFGVTGTCRASFAMYNTRDEVDALADAVAGAIRFFS